MKTCPLTVKEAEEFLAKHERHYKVPVEPICAIGIGEDEATIEYMPGECRTTPTGKFILHGAAILGRRDAETAELAHIYVDGTFQGYSILYGACWRALKALGYQRTIL